MSLKFLANPGKNRIFVRMEKGKLKIVKPVKNALVREEILQGMITSFRLEGIKIPQETAHMIMERVDLKLRMQK